MVKIASVVLIDDDLFIRTSIAAGLKAFGIKVVGHSENFVGALEIMKSADVEVAVVDLDLGPGPNGIDICYSLRKHYPNLGLILLTSYTDPKVADPHSLPLPKGCRFVSKTNLEDFSVLVNEIISARMKPLTHTAKISNKNSLTAVQMDVLKLVSEGLSSAEIAARRGVSVKSIEGIISKIHNSLGLDKSKSFNQRVQLTRAYFSLSGKKPPGA